MTASLATPSARRRVDVEALLSLYLDARREIEELTTTNARLRHLLTHDELTGALNGRAYKQKLTELIASLVNPVAPAFAAAHLDIDGFKQIQDKLADHAVGDHLIRHFHLSVQNQLPATDLFFRRHGDEFALLMQVRNAAELKLVLTRFRGPFNTTWNGQAIRFTASIGAAIVSRPCRRVDLKAVLERAAYTAKQSVGIIVVDEPARCL